MAGPDFDLKERVRSAVDLVDVVSSTLELRPQGRNFVARCPWHDDRKPSLNINPVRQTWKCWVCDVGGDVFSFVMQRDGIDFGEALRFLAETAGIPIEQYRRTPAAKPGSPEDRETLFKALETITADYAGRLQNPRDGDSKIAAEYLRERGIDDENREKFRIGFAPDRWTEAVERLAADGIGGAVAAAAGVASPRKSGDGYVDMFRGRLMFPITDLQNRVISMGGRVIPQIAQRHDDPGGKYVNGRETLLFKKSSTLYGLAVARDAIRREKSVLVMEGYTDVIAAHAAGIETAVAVLGTALTPDHVKLLRRFAPRVTLVLDGDEAGRRRADEVLELFTHSDVDLRILTLPEGADPADFITERGPEALANMVDAAPDALDHKLSRLTASIDTDADTHAVAAAADALLQSLAAAPDGLKIDQMIRRISQRLEFAPERLTRRLQHFRDEARNRKRFQRTVAPEQVETPVPTKSRRQYPAMAGLDQELFECLIQSPELAASAIETILPSWLDSSTARALLTSYQEMDLEGKDLDVDTLMTHIEDDGLKTHVVTLIERVDQRAKRIAESGGEPVPPSRRYNDLLIRFDVLHVATQADQHIETLRTAELGDEDEISLLAKLFDQEKRRQTRPPG